MMEPAKKIRVLMVDDHAVVRAGYRMLLKNSEDIEVVAKMPFLPATSETLANAKTQPTSVSAGAIFEPLEAALSEIAATDKTPEDIFTELQEVLKDVTNE